MRLIDEFLTLFKDKDETKLTVIGIAKVKSLVSRSYDDTTVGFIFHKSKLYIDNELELDCDDMNDYLYDIKELDYKVIFE